MPLDVRRILCVWHSTSASAEACWYGLILWCVAWHQVPAGSLPDEDALLAQFVGYGKAVREWRKIREKALTGWEKAADGRLYHPDLCRVVLEAWQAKLIDEYRRMGDRMRSANRTRRVKGLTAIEIPTFEAWNTDGRAGPAMPSDAVSTSLPGAIPAEVPDWRTDSRQVLAMGERLGIACVTGEPVDRYRDRVIAAYEAAQKEAA